MAQGKQPESAISRRINQLNDELNQAAEDWNRSNKFDPDYQRLGQTIHRAAHQCCFIQLRFQADNLFNPTGDADNQAHSAVEHACLKVCTRIVKDGILCSKQGKVIKGPGNWLYHVAENFLKKQIKKENKKTAPQIDLSRSSKQTGQISGPNDELERQIHSRGTLTADSTHDRMLEQSRKDILQTALGMLAIENLQCAEYIRAYHFPPEGSTTLEAAGKTFGLEWKKFHYELQKCEKRLKAIARTLESKGNLALSDEPEESEQLKKKAKEV